MISCSLYHVVERSSIVFLFGLEFLSTAQNKPKDFVQKIQKGTAAGKNPQQYHMRIIEINDILRPGNGQSASDIPPLSCQTFLQDRRDKEIPSYLD